MTVPTPHQAVTPLDVWLGSLSDDQFPPCGGQPYPARFKAIADYLNENVHPHVEKGFLVQEGGYLTDHGPNHIATVILRATEMLPDSRALSPYEVYLLLTAAHLHDVGNLYGREEHEKKLAPIMEKLNQLLGSEMVERRAITQIAQAHGGKVEGDKDTIDRLPTCDPVLGQDVRYQALAAILRFADELADDTHRAARVIADLGQLPVGSEVFHAYARALHSVQVRPSDRQIRLRFSISREAAERKFGKLDGDTFLLDEIYERTVKMHFEREYCMRFTHGLVRLDVIDVQVEVFEDEHSPVPCVDPIGYRLRSRGYPSSHDHDIRKLCPELSIDGEQLQSTLKGASHER